MCNSKALCVRGMAADPRAFADRSRLVNKVEVKIWHYYAYIADSQGKPTDTTKHVCKRCFKPTQTKGANVSNLAKHLIDRHADLFNEFEERQVSECDR